MNKGPLILIGVLFIMAWSFYGIIGKNLAELGHQDPIKLDTGEPYPGGRPNFAQVGQEVYRANGCASCHTMQVRMKGYGADIERHWGARNTVLADFLYDRHVFLGNVRVGPDLADIGTRSPDPRTQLLHLYNPRITVPDSMMPQFPYLFEKRKITGERSAAALNLTAKYVKEGYEIIPTREADALVAYLTSLHASTYLLEAPQLPPPPPKTNAAPAAAAPAEPAK